jgi:hypothetical protein
MVRTTQAGILVAMIRFSALEIVFALHLPSVHLMKSQASKATLKEYLEGIGSGFQCFWSNPGTWNRDHGDGKSASGGKFHSETMTSTTSPAEYKIRVKEKKLVNKKMKEVVVYEQSWPSQPSDAQVVQDLQAYAGTLKS